MSAPTFAFLLEGDELETFADLPALCVTLETLTGRVRTVIAYGARASVRFDFAAHETLLDGLEVAEQDLATEDLCFDSPEEEALAREVLPLMVKTAQEVLR